MTISKEAKAQAKKLFEKNKKIKGLWVNNLGEFFDKENLAKNSVKKPENFTYLNRELKEIEEKDEQGDNGSDERAKK